MEYKLDSEKVKEATTKAYYQMKDDLADPRMENVTKEIKKSMRELAFVYFNCMEAPEVVVSEKQYQMFCNFMGEDDNEHT